jgi:CheY-like chemotaxis protein
MTVIDAAGGEAARALADSGARFDVALVDMKMPNTTDEEVAITLRGAAATSAVPLISMSGRGERSQLGRPDLFFAALTKPVKTARLIQSLTDAVATGVAPDHRLDARIGVPDQPTPMRVLLVDDNTVNQRVGRAMLEKLGHRVDVAANGIEAVDAVGLMPYDAVFMDVQMPVMDGLDATRRIRSELPANRQPTIIAVTANVTPEDQANCRQAGMDHYLPKPFRLEQLAAVLADLQAMPAASGAAS